MDVLTGGKGPPMAIKSGKKAKKIRFYKNKNYIIIINFHIDIHVARFFFKKDQQFLVPFLLKKFFSLLNNFSTF